MTRSGLFALALLAACDDPCPATGSDGDALTFLSSSLESRFFETTDAIAGDGVIYTCSGIRSLGVHDASDPERLDYEGKTTFADHQGMFPRCSHLDLQDDRLLVTARQDELQTTAFAALLDVSDPLDPQILDTHATSGSFEEGALVGDRALVTAHNGGLQAFTTGGGTLEPEAEIDGLGNAVRVAATAAGGALVGTQEGAVWRLDDGLVTTHTADLDASVQALLELQDGRVVAALGSAGLAVLDPELVPIAELDTGGTALRLDLLGNGDLLVVNWSDVRVYDVHGEVPELVAVESVFASNDQPRILAGAAQDDLVYAGAWEGVYAYRYLPGLTGPELSTGAVSVKVPGDGHPHDAELILANEGPEELLLTEVRPPRRWSVLDAPDSIEPWGLASLWLRYEGATRKRTSELEICSNDDDERPGHVALQGGSSRIGVGERFPDFDYRGLNDGERHALGDLCGQVVLLAYFATF